VERIFATIVLFIAFVVAASYVGSVTSSMTQLQVVRGEQSSKMSALRRFLSDHNISRPLAVRVQRNAQHAMVEMKSKAPESSVALLQVISEPVLAEVHFEIHSRVLMSHPFFLAYNDINQFGIRKVCHNAISMLSLHSKDVLFTDLEVPTAPRMFFVVSGSLRFMQNKVVIPVDKGSYLCEAVLWTLWTHCGTARAQTETRLLVLDAEKFQDTISYFATEHAQMYAAAFVNWLNSTEGANDLGPSKSEVYQMINTAFPPEETEEDELLDGENRNSNASGRMSASASLWRRGASQFFGVNVGGTKGSVASTDSRGKTKLRSSGGKSKGRRKWAWKRFSLCWSCCSRRA